MSPQDPVPGQAPPLPGAFAEQAPPRPVYHWYHKMSAVVFVTFCLEVGLFLLIFPWTDYWDTNYFSTLIPAWSAYWGNLYVRGAISGLGMVNLYISFIEIFRLRRFARR